MNVTKKSENKQKKEKNNKQNECLNYIYISKKNHEKKHVKLISKEVLLEKLI